MNPFFCPATPEAPLFLLRTRSSGAHWHSHALPLGVYQALAHWAEECQDCLLPWKLPSDSCPPPARMEEMWGWDYHEFTSATTPLCWRLEQRVLYPCHTWSWTAQAQPCRRCWSYWCACTGVKGAWKRSSGTTFEFPDASVGGDECCRCPIHKLGSSGISTIK